MESGYQLKVDPLPALFSCDKETDSSSDASASDKEWRDAIKAAVENEIQYQVQLRLALDGISEQDIERQEDTEAVQLLELRARKRTRCSRQSTDQLASQDPMITDGIRFEGQQQQQQQQPDESLDTTMSLKPQLYVKKDNQTIYDYLYSKYGTPYDQLKHLMQNGRFLSPSEKVRAEVTIDQRVRWPVECNIIQPTPQLSTHQIQPKMPMQSFGPLLGQVRSSFHHATSFPVYDCKEEIELCTSELMFESRFESGNLRQAIQVGSYEYNLVLNTDLYTERHTQWFYFKVRGMKSTVTYTFNIINFRKKDSLYNHGMKMLMYSEREGGWQRVGHNIGYYKLSNHHCPLLKSNIDYYCLSWKMEFTHDEDTCYFSHCYPYTFSSLLALLDKLEQDEQSKRYIQQEVFCETLAGNPCPLITITDFDTCKDKWSQRMGVVFTSRVHPGETNSSWIMQGILEYLTSEHKHAKYLRSHYVFKLVPMINPDGVVVGNYRTSLSGVDLNRVYKNPNEKVFPTVYCIKKLLQTFMEERKIALYVDLHGHSRKHNIFMYGCHTPQCDHNQFLQERVVPWLLSQISKEKFSFKACKFAVQRCKEATGRVATWRMGIANSFTMEASFCGTDLSKPFPLHFTQQDLMIAGQDLCELLLKLQHYYKSSSYRYKVHCRIAEYFMEQQDTLQSSNLQTALPDIVASATKGEEEGSAEKKKRIRQKMAKCLHKFHALSMRILEQESSTSGSDSEDDNFMYKNKYKSRHKHQKRKKMLDVVSSHSTVKCFSHTDPVITSFTKSQQDNIEEDVSVKSCTNEVVHVGGGRDGNKQTSSAPPRLQRASHPLHGWRFVNKYTHRSNGGIPMFAEERLKERSEKLRLKSQSVIESTEVTQLPYLVNTTTTTPLLPPLVTSSVSAASKPSTIWSTTAYSTLFAQKTERELSQCKTMKQRRHNDIIIRGGNTSSHLHYQQIKGLVESHRKVHRPIQPHPQNDIVGRLPHLSSNIPPHLLQYISEIWHKHLGGTR